jgi:hypothetical protein
MAGRPWGRTVCSVLLGFAVSNLVSNHLKHLYLGLNGLFGQIRHKPMIWCGADWSDGLDSLRPINAQNYLSCLDCSHALASRSSNTHHPASMETQVYKRGSAASAACWWQASRAASMHADCGAKRAGVYGVRGSELINRAGRTASCNSYRASHALASRGTSEQGSVHVLTHRN